MIEFLEEDVTYIDEKFSAGIMPQNLTPIARVYGNELFTSKQLKQEFINLIQSNKKLAPVIDQIIKLIEINDIVPCYTSSNLISFYSKKLWKTFSSVILESGKPAIAFYSNKPKKIFVLFEYQVDYFLNVNEQKLTDVLLHEMQHYCADKLGMKHYKIFEKIYIKWFQTFFQIYLSKVKIPENLISEIPLYLFKNTEITKNLFDNEKYWIQYEDIIFRLFDRLGAKKEWAKGYFDYIIMFYSDPNCLELVSLLKNKTSPYLEIYLSIFEAYSRLGYKKLYTFPGQELLYVSEIACMTSTNPLDDSIFPNVHQSAIKALTTI